MKKVGMAIVAIAVATPLWGQYSLSGKITTNENAALPGATISIAAEGTGAIADGSGLYRISDLSKGSYQVQVRFVGFVDQKVDLTIDRDMEVNFVLEEDVWKTDELIVYATRARENTPTTYTDVSKTELQARNLGQDLPILLNFTPSIVTTSDAGAGVGYTGMRIRGSDGTRINVTMNGIPVNDAESHGVFWVNMPDFSSSVSNIQIQRGVGTSTNGAGAFGATVNMQTNGPSETTSVAFNSSVGSFGTFKTNASFNSGYLNKFNFEGRVSRIVSDGYIDRSAADLSSYFLTGGYYGRQTQVKVIVFGGRENTQQAWYGTPEARLKNDPVGLQNVIDLGGEYQTAEQVNNLLNSGRRFNYYLYDNEVDDYAQDHYQLHASHTFSRNFDITGALHYTFGRGYFEQFRSDDSFFAYNLPDLVIGDSTISQSDFIRRRWLKNDFYGATYSANYHKEGLQLTLGGAWNQYDGDHFGEIIWAEFSSTSKIRDRYYEGQATKTDFNTYLKANQQLGKHLNLFGDLQIRNITYETAGTDNDLLPYNVEADYFFFNPKFGLTATLSETTTAYGSFGIGNREPTRNDFIDAPLGNTPKAENLKNIEAGIRKQGQTVSFEANYFLMDYKNQLVLTGAVNDVGSSIRTNVPKSYRTGIELSGIWKLTQQLSWAANATFSQNKVLNFTEVSYDYAFPFGEPGYEVQESFSKTDISFSPNLIAGSTFTYQKTGFTAQLLSKYVSKQYLDNTSNKDRAIDAYATQDLLLTYNLESLKTGQITFSLLLNNLLNTKYESNGYTWGYLYEGFRYQQNNYYPQAGFNVLGGVSITFN